MFFSRGLNKIQNPCNISEMYTHYKETVEDKTLYDITYTEWMTILDDYFKQISEGLLNGKGAFKMPFSLGRIDITKKKLDLTKLHRVDWKATVESGKKVYHLNEHSDGFNYKIEWDNPRRVRNSKLYVYSATRRLKRTLAERIKSRAFDTYEL